MAFWKRKKAEKRTLNVDDVYVATATIVSSCGDGSHCGPRVVTWYFATNSLNEEIFSGKKLEKDEDVTLNSFDTPYITKSEPLKTYLKDKNKKEIDIEELFDFITNMNVGNSLRTSKS